MILNSCPPCTVVAGRARAFPRPRVHRPKALLQGRPGELQPPLGEGLDRGRLLHALLCALRPGGVSKRASS